MKVTTSTRGSPQLRKRQAIDKNVGEIVSHISRFVVEVTVIEHLPIVLYALLGTAVDTVLQVLLDGPHVHGPLDNLEIVRQVESHWINRFMKRPCIMVSP
jgi:hypothetical protein